MKANIIKTMVVGVCAAVGIQLVAEEAITGWRYSISDGKATITGVSQYTAPVTFDESLIKTGSQGASEGVCSDEGFIFNLDLKFFREPEGNLTIPSVIVGYPVTAIGSAAFLNCWRITSVKIPEGVETIGNRAFEGCQSLKRVSIPCTVKSIGEYAFDGCSSLESVEVPASVTSIGIGAFGGCSGLKAATFPAWCQHKMTIINEILCNSHVSVGKGAKNSSCGSQICLSFRDICTPTEGTVPPSWKKAFEQTGKVMRSSSDEIYGVIAIKCGKANSSGIAKVSATITWLDGSKTFYRSHSVDVMAVPVVANLDGLTITFSDAAFSGYGNGINVASAKIGGAFSSGTFRLADDFDFSVPGSLQYGLLPKAVPFTVSGQFWRFAKNSVVKLARNADTGLVELVVDSDKGRTNSASLKLGYNAKTGNFKGSFKVYVLKSTGDMTKLIRYPVSVNGFVVDGKGFGQAVIKNPVGGPWSVRID